MKFEVTILGNTSAFPSHGRFNSSQVLNHNEELLLIDCGEGTQIRLSEFGVKRSRIEHIFISHLHGDHVFGLPGLINSYHHFGRTAPLDIYGPPGIRAMIDTVLRLSHSTVDFDIRYHEIQQHEKHRIYENRDLRVYAFPLRHRVTTYGFLFQEKQHSFRIRKDAIPEYSLSVEQIRSLKEGKSVVSVYGDILTPSDVALPAPAQRSYAYCSDTMFEPSLAAVLENVTMLYHESTFLHALEHKATETTHSTALQAGTLAHMANAGKLLLGHFSSRYDDLQAFAAEAKEIFAATEVAMEGSTYSIE